MLGFVKNWLGTKANPIGVDFGTDSVKLAQVALVNGEWRLTAAASADVPSHARHDSASRMAFLAQATRELLSQGNFNGRQAVLALPSASTFIQHLRLPKMDEEATKKALPWEARGKLPIDPSHALLRHHVAGEIYQEQEAKNEVILMAAGKELVNQYLGMASRAKLDVTGMIGEPRAMVDCFSHIYRRKADAEITSLFVDLGSSGSRAVIARGGHILFARAIPMGGDHLTRAVAHALNISHEDAKLLRMRLCNSQPAAGEVQQKREVTPPPSAAPDEGFALLGAALAAAEKREPQTATATAPAARIAPVEQVGSGEAEQVELACREPLMKLVEELNLCRRYHEATFPNLPVGRIIFVGGEARHRSICQQIAQEMGLAAQVGDPLVRMGRVSDVGPESGIDRRQPQPNWAVAIGLSLGPAAVLGDAASGA